MPKLSCVVRTSAVLFLVMIAVVVPQTRYWFAHDAASNQF